MDDPYTITMVPSPQLQSGLENIRQNKVEDVEPLVMDFLEIWVKIHNEAPELNIADVPEYAQELLKTHTLPLYEQYKELTLFQKYDAWINDFSALAVSWRGGIIMFPLRLITYEIVSHEDRILEYYLSRLQTGEVDGTLETFTNFLFPRLINVAIPLKDVDLVILKSFLDIDQANFDYFKGFSAESAAVLTEASKRTIFRRLKLLNFSQIPIPIYFLDMGALGYETFLVSHFKPLTQTLAPYIVHSVDLNISQFSLIQVPTRNPRIYKHLQDSLEPVFFTTLSERVHSWNLSGLGEGRNGWKVPPPFIHTYPTRNIEFPSPHLKFSLACEFDPFRKLTRPDIKLLEFITTQGTVSSVKKLSQTIKMTVPDLTKRMREYQEHRIIQRSVQLFNIGLNLSIYFFISSPKSIGISWQNLLTSFAKVDVFYGSTDDMNTYFGFLKLPSKFYKDFTRKIKMVKEEYPEVKFYYTVEPADIVRWNLALSKTYK